MKYVSIAIGISEKLGFYMVLKFVSFNMLCTVMEKIYCIIYSKNL